MSEYQYYEFQTIDRPLTSKEQAEIKELSSRVKLTPTQAIFLYNYGSFHNQPEEVLAKYFDAMFYIANWGTWQLIFRFPKAIVNPKWFQTYDLPNAITITQTAKYDDVRITTRFYGNDLSQGLFSTIHEMGHAFYELGNAPEFEGTPLAGGVSSGVHESQSRLWENLVGRSRPFWQYFYPQLQAHFPSQLRAIPLETFYRAINRVSRSFIRTDADEITYNLHVMIRFDLELDLLEGKLAVKDLPAAWNARYHNDLGITPTSDGNGVLQDVHWYTGQIGGMFQGYTLGNLMSAQIFEAAVAAHPEILDRIETGNFTVLHGWLQANIYRHGRKFTAAETIERVTGQPLSTQPLMDYIHRKYGELYEI